MAALWMWMLGIGFVGGIVGFLLFSFLIAPELPKKLRKPIGNIYAKAAMWAFGSAALVQRKDGSYELVPFSYDAEDSDAVVFDVDGEERKVENATDSIKTLHRRKFTILLEDFAATLEPWMAGVGEAEKAKADGGEQQVAVDTMEDGTPVLAVNPYTRIKEGVKAVDMRPVLRAMSRSGDSQMPQRVQQRTEAAENAGESDFKILLIAGVSFFAGVGLMMLTGGGGGGGASVVMPFISLVGGI
jgi:hypothetical protein